MEILEHYPQFFTSTILEWKHLLKPDKYKEIIIESLRFLVKERRVVVYSFVIMDNHLHIIWQMREGIKRENLQRDFLKFTAQQIKFDLLKNHPRVLEKFKVDLKDRMYQIWERNPLSIDLYTSDVLIQKSDYIHQNPVRAGICGLEEDYFFSSASYYRDGIDNWGFLSHYDGW